MPGTSNPENDSTRPITVLSVFGTRPEAIKMAPVVRALAACPERIRNRVCVTAQHREMLDDVLDTFGITPDHDLNVMRRRQTPARVAAAVLSRLEPVLTVDRPDWVLVQGDTCTAAAAGIGAFYAGARVAHVEAGLRSFERRRPFPEEINRKLAAAVADLHFAPTRQARENLLAEGVSSDAIVVTGNPVIDALHEIAAQPSHAGGPLDGLPTDRPWVLVTAHRRESLGVPLDGICRAIHALASHYGDSLEIVFPMHPNPRVRRTVTRWLGDQPNVRLLGPLRYRDLVAALGRCHLVLTDSGEIQEEAPGLGKPGARAA